MKHYFITVADVRFKNTLDIFQYKYIAAFFSRNSGKLQFK